MIDWAPVAFSVAGLALVFFASSYLRVGGSLISLAAAGFGLGRILDWQTALALLSGPGAAILLLGAPRSDSRITFEGVALKAVSLSAAFAMAVFAASHTDLTDQVWPTILPAWLIATAGLVLILVEVQGDAVDFALLGAGGSGLLLVATGSSSAFLALACGLSILLAAAIPRYRLFTVGGWSGPVLLAATLLFSLLALWGHLPSRIEVGGIGLSATGISVIFVALFALLRSSGPQAGSIWSVVLAGLSLIASGLPLRWSALLAMGSNASVGRRPIYAAIGALGLASIAQVGLAQPLQGRITAVAIAVAVVFSLLSARQAIGSVPGAALAGYLVLLISGLPASITSRMQLLTCAAIGLVVLLEVFSSMPHRSGMSTERVLTFALLVLALLARDDLGLGVAAAVLLLLALGLADLPAEAGEAWPAGARLLRLARSGWPPAAAFAGRVLAVVASFAVSWPYGLMATALYACLLVFRPTADRQGGQPGRWSLALAATSLLLGIAPGLLFRLLRS